MTLRELKRGMEDGTVSLYDVVVALVEAVEPQECPQGCDATIRKLREERDELVEKIVVMSRPGPRADGGWLGPPRAHILDPAKVEPEDTELAEAKAEIERLRKELNVAYDGFKATAQTLREHRGTDAEIGRLVRGMRFDSRLSRGEQAYFSEYWRDDALWKDGSWHADPAEALRAIQEVDDSVPRLTEEEAQRLRAQVERDLKSDIGRLRDEVEPTAEARNRRYHETQTEGVGDAEV